MSERSPLWLVPPRVAGPNDEDAPEMAAREWWAQSRLDAARQDAPVHVEPEEVAA